MQVQRCECGASKDARVVQAERFCLPTKAKKAYQAQAPPTLFFCLGLKQERQRHKSRQRKESTYMEIQIFGRRHTIKINVVTSFPFLFSVFKETQEPTEKKRVPFLFPVFSDALVFALVRRQNLSLAHSHSLSPSSTLHPHPHCF